MSSENATPPGGDQHNRVNITLTPDEADIVRCALAEELQERAKYAEDELETWCGNGNISTGLQDAAWKVRRMASIVDLLDAGIGYLDQSFQGGEE